MTRYLPIDYDDESVINLSVDKHEIFQRKKMIP